MRLSEWRPPVTACEFHRLSSKSSWQTWSSKWGKFAHQHSANLFKCSISTDPLVAGRQFQSSVDGVNGRGGAWTGNKRCDGANCILCGHYSFPVSPAAATPLMRNGKPCGFPRSATGDQVPATSDWYPFPVTVVPSIEIGGTNGPEASDPWSENWT